MISYILLTVVASFFYLIVISYTLKVMNANLFIIQHFYLHNLSGRRHMEDGTKVVACYSIERDDVPPIKGYVRAHIYHSGSFCFS